MMTPEQEDEFYKLSEEYVTILHYMNIFIETNGLDYDEIWDRANQRYDEDLSICAENNG